MKIAEARSVGELVEALSAGGSAEYLFFWGHTPKTPGVADKSCLSNWFPASFELDGSRYPTTEHQMMCGKAKLFGDDEVHDKMLAVKNPHDVKALGRQVRNYDDAVWKQNCFEIVVAGNVAKFSQNPPLLEFLKSTGDKVLVEASPQDRIWGIGMDAQNADASQPAKWQGTNLLGFAIMEARARLLNA